MTKFHAWAETEEETQVGVLLSRDWSGHHIVIESEHGEPLSSHVTLRLVDVLLMLRETQDDERAESLQELYERWSLTKDRVIR